MPSQGPERTHIVVIQSISQGSGIEETRMRYSWRQLALVITIAVLGGMLVIIDSVTGLVLFVVVLGVVIFLHKRWASAQVSKTHNGGSPRGNQDVSV